MVNVGEMNCCRYHAAGGPGTSPCLIATPAELRRALPPLAPEAAPELIQGCGHAGPGRVCCDCSFDPTFP